MTKLFYRLPLFTLLIYFLFVIFLSHAYAQTPMVPQVSYEKGTVVSMLKEGTQTIGGNKNAFQDVSVEIATGSEKGKKVPVEISGDAKFFESQKVHLEETVVLSKTVSPTGVVRYDVYDTFRLYNIAIIAFIFLLLVVFIAGKKGVGSLIGLCISLFIIFSFIVPNIIQGKDPLTISIIGSMFILFLTTYLAHGFSKKTSVAVAGTFISLIFTALISVLFVHFAMLFGLGNEDAYMLQVGANGGINAQGLLLGGIIIGTLGALNDITTTQVTSIYEIAKAHPKIKILDLYEKGFVIGKEHVVSLVNTLVLAYAGSAFAVFIFFLLNPLHLPIWVIINNEIVADEIIRTIGGSMGLIFSVPLVTLLASWFVVKKEKF